MCFITKWISYTYTYVPISVVLCCVAEGNEEVSFNLGRGWGLRGSAHRAGRSWSSLGGTCTGRAASGPNPSVFLSLALRHSLTSSGAFLLSTQLHPTLGNYPTGRQRGSLTGPQSLLMGVQNTHKKHTRTQAYTCMHTHAHTQTHAYAHMNTRARTHVQFTHRCTRAHIYTQMGSCTHKTHAHTCTHSHSVTSRLTQW